MISIFHIDFTALTPHISDKSLNNLKFTISHVYAHEKIFIPCYFIKAAGNKVGLYTHYLSKNHDKWWNLFIDWPWLNRLWINGTDSCQPRVEFFNEAQKGTRCHCLVDSCIMWIIPMIKTSRIISAAREIVKEKIKVVIILIRLPRPSSLHCYRDYNLI